MLWLYRYLFYRQYYLNLKDWGGDSLWALMSGIGAVCAVVFFQLFALIWLIDLILGTNILGQFLTGNLIQNIVLAFVLFWLVSSYFVIGQRYKKILKEFDDLKETEQQKLRGVIRLWVFVVISCMLWLVPACASLLVAKHAGS